MDLDEEMREKGETDDNHFLSFGTPLFTTHPVFARYVLLSSSVCDVSVTCCSAYPLSCSHGQVSAFSTWDKELPKFCFDKRYLLLSTKERRAAFEDFIRERADEERREKKSKLKEVKEGFRMLLAEAKLTPK